MNEELEQQIRERIEGYEGILDIVIEEPRAYVNPWFGEKPIVRLSESLLTYVVIANSRTDIVGWRQCSVATVYDKYKVQTKNHKILSVEKMVD